MAAGGSSRNAKLDAALPGIAGGSGGKDILFGGRVILKSDQLPGVETVAGGGDIGTDSRAPAAQHDVRCGHIKLCSCQHRTGAALDIDRMVTRNDLIRNPKNYLVNSAVGPRYWAQLWCYQNKSKAGRRNKN